MFVTSDIFDLEQIALSRGIAGWRERLVGGIAVHGTDWPGAQAAAHFLVEAAQVCGLQEQLPIAGYSVQWGEPSEHVEPGAIGELADGALPSASAAASVYLLGTLGDFASHDRFRYGGGLAAAQRKFVADGNPLVPDFPYRAFDGDFEFPSDGLGSEQAERLLRLAAEVLGADYGYFFVRDGFASPDFYAQGLPCGLGRSRLAHADNLECDLWRKFVGEGELWTGAWPQLRDLFAVNLLSTRHMTDYIEPIGYLDEWITAEPGRGRLREAADGKVLWTLTDAEIHAVRPVLWNSVSMRSCMPRVYRDLSYARERPDPETGQLPSARISGT